jgi:DNA-binding CsgD family transcriptional regulator
MISARENIIAGLIAWGASDKEVALELRISPETARTHRKNILQKIGGHNAADLTRWFFQNQTGLCFGLSPRRVIHLACFFLALTIYSEFVHCDMIRTRTARVVKMAKISRARRKDTYLMSA